MKLPALCLAGFAALAFGKCITKPCSGKCVAALIDVLEVGEGFCSSYLSLEPATETVTETVTATAVHTNIETVVDVVTLTTLTTTVAGPTTTLYAKRGEPSAGPSSQILAQCGNAASRVSSACSCILSTTSTVTVSTTVTATEAAEATVTTTETITTGATATEYASPTVTVKQQVLVNGAFEDYLTTGNILPWTTSTSSPSAGRVEVVNGVNPCTAGGAYCSGGRVVIRVYPPTSGGGYAWIQEPFPAKPSTTYNVSFMYRCLNFDTSAGIDVYFNGAKIGGAKCLSSGSAFDRVTSGIQFTTDETGAGSLEVRFVNPSNLPYLYMYADDFQANSI